MNAQAPHAEFNVPEAALASRIRKDLLAEAIELLIAEAAQLRIEIRYDDDEAIVERFRRVDIPFRTAKQCALEIRDGTPERRS